MVRYMLMLLLLAASLAAAESVAPVAPESAEAPTPQEVSAGAKKKAPEDLLGKALDVFEKGGPVMYILLLTSVVGLTFALERLVSLRRRRHIPRGLVGRLEQDLREKTEGEARLGLKQSDSALARVLDSILARKGASREEQERVLEDEAGRVLWDMRLLTRPVGIVATVAPLIGLLGTVFGLIAAFQQAAELGMDDPRNFASGIYEALYTTAFGLTVAIPFVVLYHYLRGKADVIVREVEDLAIQFIIDYDALQESKNAETPR